MIYAAYNVIGRGVGQVMLQNNALSGWVMLAGISIHSWQMGLLTLFGTVVSTLTAYIFGFDKEDVDNGLYGFNGALVGLAAGMFIGVCLESVLFMVAGSVFSSWIARLFTLQRTLSGYTAPFILSVWVLLTLCEAFLPEILQSPGVEAGTAQSLHFLQSISLGIGQVMFQNSILTGVSFLLAMAVHSRISALYSLWGALLCVLLSMMCGIDVFKINEGLMGYNGVLCAVALGQKSMGSFLKASCAVCISVVLQWAGMCAGLVTLTAPFVVSVWIINAFRKHNP